MAQVATDAQLDSARKHSLIPLEDWLKEAAAERLVGEPVKKKSKKGVDRVEATTKVTGRPSTNSSVGNNGLQSQALPPPPVEVDLAGKNWVGLLLEYRNAHPVTTGPDYQELSPGMNLYSCRVTIGEHPEPFGHPNVTFSRKKDAKQYAAKLAIEWLIASKHMPADGSLSFPKSRPQQAAKENQSGMLVLIDDSTTSNDKGPSFGQRVAELCAKLAMSPPVYNITAHDDFKAMYSGYASFENSPLIVGRVGEFSNVYGKKRARESCAEKVLEFLEGIAALRGGNIVVEKVPETESGGSLLD